MGIHGIFKEIGQGRRISLAKLALDHYVKEGRPFRLAVDISIWLFQIQAGKGGSNPALRTFYYRLLRLISLNIFPLFVFDGPNKPLFKRNKKVGGPGVRVASVPEFLAKQLLKQFGFPWHVAPGEAEAECALLQAEGIVDGVLSEDVDTLMFGSRVTLRNWSAENSTNSPTHVNVYYAAETKESSGLDCEGMILVALMSGGDYIVEGIPGCGPKVACDAARAGYGTRLCALAKDDSAGLQAWRSDLQHQIKTNEAKYFKRRNTTLTIPDDFPNQEVLGYYTRPCVSATDKLVKLSESLQWDQPLDFTALRTFTADAFDWRCLGGAKKFIRNLAPAMLVRDLRLRASAPDKESLAQDKRLVTAIHGKRTHSTTDHELEYRVTYIPAEFVPIDLSIEEEDDDSRTSGEQFEDCDNDVALMNANENEALGDAEPESPIKKRSVRPYFPDQPERVWILRDYLQEGCPDVVEDYETATQDPKRFLESKRRAREAAAKGKRKGKEISDKSQTSMTLYTRTTKVDAIGPRQGKSVGAGNLEDRSQDKAQSMIGPASTSDASNAPDGTVRNVFRMPPERKTTRSTQTSLIAPLRSFGTTTERDQEEHDPQETPKHRKRRSPEPASPDYGQRTIESFWSPSPRRTQIRAAEIISLLSSPAGSVADNRPRTPVSAETSGSAGVIQGNVTRTSDWSLGELPDTVTKRRKKNVLKRHQTAPIQGEDVELLTLTSSPVPDHLRTPSTAPTKTIDAIDLAMSSPARVNVDKGSDIACDEINLASSPLYAQPGPSKPHSDRCLHNPVPTSLHGIEKCFMGGHTGAKNLVRRSPRNMTHIKLRDSLAGCWRETDVEDLTSPGTSTMMKKRSKEAKAWRISAVEVLDLTGR